MFSFVLSLPCISDGILIGYNSDEIKFLEVLKKIIESGWIVCDDEMLQIMEFLKFRSSMFQENAVLQEFLKFSLSELNLKGAVSDYIVE